MSLLSLARRWAKPTATDPELTGPRGREAEGRDPASAAQAMGRLLATCANPGCRSGWLQVWRSRSKPVFENGWTCSVERTRACVQRAIAREMEGYRAGAAAPRHRIPLGLLLVEQGWIGAADLRGALEAQKTTGQGRIGQWLVLQRAVSEEILTKVLALQWGCPVLATEAHDPDQLAAVAPRLFLEAFGVLPLRIAAQKLLYLGFEQNLDPALAFAVERMTGLRVESGIVRESLFRPAHARMLAATYPPVEVIEAESLSAAAYALAKAIERCKAAQSRLVRVHGCLWLRIWVREPEGSLRESGWIKDVICSLGAN